MIMKEVLEQCPNIEHDEDSEEVTLAEQIANLAHRSYVFMKGVDMDMPKVFLEFQMGLIYSRLDDICEAMELEPITDVKQDLEEGE
jgi:hypothetical protein